MALNGARNNFHATGKSKSAGTSLALNGGSTQGVAAGEIIYVVFGGDNIDTTDGATSVVSSITDQASPPNTYIRVREFTNGQGAAAGGATVSIWYAVASAAVSNGSGMITITHNSITARGAIAFNSGGPDAGTKVSAVATTAVATDGANVASLALSGLTSTMTCFVGAWAHEGPDGDTVDFKIASWTPVNNAPVGVLTSGAGAASNNGVFHGTMIASTVGATWAASAASRDHAGILAAFQLKNLPASLITVPANADHSVTAPALQKQMIPVAPTDGHTVAAGGLAQLNTLRTVAANADHTVAAPAVQKQLITVAPIDGHTVAAPALLRILPTINANADHTVAAPGLVQNIILKTVPANADHTVAAPPLQKQLIAVAPTDGHTVAAPAMLRILPVANAIADHTVAAPGLTVATGNVIPVAATADHTVSAPSLSQANTLPTVPATVGHTVAAPSLSQSNTLTVVSVTEGHSVVAGGLAQANALVVVSSTEGHTVAAPAVVQDFLLRVVDALSGHTADDATFGGLASFTIVVVNATLGHTADPLTVTAFIAGNTTPDRTYYVLPDGRRIFSRMRRNSTIGIGYITGG